MTIKRMNAFESGAGFPVSVRDLETCDLKFLAGNFNFSTYSS